MKTHFMFLALLVSASVTAQTIKLNVTPADAEIFVNSAPGSKVKTTPSDGAVAYKPGYATQGKTGEDIAKEAKSEYTFKLVKKAGKLPTGSVTQKIEFTKLVDRTGRLNTPTVSYGWYGTYQGIDLSDPKFGKAIADQLTTNGYKIVGTNSVFSSKSDVPELALAGEVTWFTKETRGSGFQVSVIVNWSLYDVNDENVVLEVSTAGYSDSKKGFNDELMAALKDATAGLLTEPKFAEIALQKGDSKSASKEEALGLSTVAKKTYNSYGDMVKNVVNSCLTIKTNFGHGSGFLISDKGYIVTNNHVISGADKITVVFDNGFSFDATLVRKDADRDVALLKISGSGFKALPVNTKGEVETGAEVAAVGTPAKVELGQTVTKGIISGSREIEGKTYIQTDVAVNSGNSGGPLINASGEVIGVVVSKIFGKNVEGLAFAIPISEVVSKLNIKFE